MEGLRFPKLPPSPLLPLQNLSSVEDFIYLFIYLTYVYIYILIFIWLHWVLVTACGI